MGENEDLLSESSTTTPDTGRTGGLLESRKKNNDYASVLNGFGGMNLNPDFKDPDFKPDATRPLRGGYIEFLGAVYVGGAPIDPKTYLLKTRAGQTTYRGRGQLRSQKTINEHVSSVRNCVNSSNWLQFHGSMETETANAKQLGKVEFLQRLNGDIKVYGLESLFSPHALDNRPKLITENIHDFTLKCVTDDHAFRARYTNECVRAYDIFETSDFALFHAIVESYLSPKLYADVQTAYADISQFAYLPGQVLLMLALEHTNNLVTYDIDEARKSFESLKLISYPGENVGDLVKDALKYLRIMDSGYSLPYNVQSTFLCKVNNTCCPNFNFQISLALQQVLEMEDSVGQHNPDQGKHEFKSSRSAGGGGQDKSGPGASSEEKDKKERRPMAPWRLVHPKDENATCEVAGQVCALCNYRQTGQVGLLTTGPKMHTTSEHGKHRAATDSGSSSPASEGNLGEVLPVTDAALDPSDKKGMYAGAFTAQALGFLAETADVDDDPPAIIQNVSSKDDVGKQMAEWDDVDGEMMFENWDMSGKAFMAQATAGNESIPASKGAYVRILNLVKISTGKKENLYGMIISPPKSGGLFYKLSVYDRGSQCFHEIRRCRDNFVVIGPHTDLPPLLTAWKPTDASGQLLAVGLGNDLSSGVHLEYLFSSRECPVANESQYTLLAQIRQHLVTYPPEIAREEVSAGYLDDDTAVSSVPEFDTSEEADSSLDITDKVNALSLYSCCLSADPDHFFDADEYNEEEEEDTFHDALEQLECEVTTVNNNFFFTPQSWFLEETQPVFTCFVAPLQLAYVFACRIMWLLSAVFWDSLECLGSGWMSLQHSSPGTTSKSDSSSSLRRYPRAWMLLSCIQLPHNAPGLFGSTPPVDRHLLQPLQQTWDRQTSLSTVLDPDLDFLLHFHRHRGVHLALPLYSFRRCVTHKKRDDSIL